MDARILIILLAVVGMGDSLYLNYERKRKRPPVCVIGHSCATVWESPYSKTFGVSNEIFGIIFYATIAVIESELLSKEVPSSMIIGEYLILSAGLAMSFYFLYLQWRVIKVWCFWCTLSALVVFAMVVARFFF